MPFLRPLLSRLKLIRATREQEQWQRYGGVSPPEEAGPSGGR